MRLFRGPVRGTLKVDLYGVADEVHGASGCVDGFRDVTESPRFPLAIPVLPLRIRHEKKELQACLGGCRLLWRRGYAPL
jgi:hypothetical protein